MIVSLLVLAVICGLAIWAVSQFPMDAVIARIVRVVVVVIFVLGVLRILGLWRGSLP